MKTQKLCSKSKPRSSHTKQLKLFPPDSYADAKKACGGSIAVGVRRKKRVLSTKTPLHLVLRSDFAYGRRSLMRHRPLIDRVLKKFSRRFRVSIYQRAIVSNHIHILIKGKTREELQNFFRVVAGHIAQEILREFPIQSWEKRARDGAPRRGEGARERANKFWQTRVFTRVMSWGRDFVNVLNYIIQNTKEALGLVKYKPRKKRWQSAGVKSKGKAEWQSIEAETS